MLHARAERFYGARMMNDRQALYLTYLSRTGHVAPFAGFKPSNPNRFFRKVRQAGRSSGQAHINLKRRTSLFL